MCKRYGGRVHEIGIMFYYALPCAFVDTTDAWMFKNKWHRVVVSLTGPFFSLILTCLYGWVWVLSMHWGFQNLSLVFGAIFLICLVNALIQFIPLIETDGYYILMDILEMPNLRRNSFSYLRSLLCNFFKGGAKPKLSKKEKRIYLVYSIFALAFVIFMLLLLFRFIKVRLTQYPGIFSWILACVGLFLPDLYSLPLVSASILVAYLIPGYMLKARAKNNGYV